MIIFEWDETKNKLNRKKHGIWFEEAKSVFEDINAKVFLDEDYPGVEERFLIIGNNSFGANLIVVHCYRKDDEVIRIISARKTTKKERMVYEERI
jgi:uncharacterized DUF497 family protein